MGRLSALLATLAVVIAACSGDGDVGSDADPGPVPSTAPLGTEPPATTSSIDGALTTTTGDEAAAADPLPDLAGVALETVVQGLSKPVFVTAPPDDQRLFVVQQDGLIRIVADGELTS